MRKENRIITDVYHLLDGHHVLMYPDSGTPYEQQLAMVEGYRNFYSFGNGVKRLFTSPQKKFVLGLLGYTVFKGGITKVADSPQMKEYLGFLKELSDRYPNYEAFANRDIKSSSGLAFPVPNPV